MFSIVAIVFYSGYTILHSHNNCKRDPISPSMFVFANIFHLNLFLFPLINTCIWLRLVTCAHLYLLLVIGCDLITWGSRQGWPGAGLDCMELLQATWIIWLLWSGLILPPHWGLSGTEPTPKGKDRSLGRWACAFSCRPWLCTLALREDFCGFFLLWVYI